MQSKLTLYLFFGPPGVGKGTLAQKCITKFNWHHLSTGTICRKHISNKTDLGIKIASIIDKGLFVDDSIMLDLLKIELKLLGNSSDIILDGFPRNYLQANIFNDFFKINFPSFDLRVVFFNAPFDLVISRLKGRIICSNSICEKIYSSSDYLVSCQVCNSKLIYRNDDIDDFVITTRLKLYNSYREEIINFWEKNNYNIIHLDSSLEIESVFKYFINKIST